MFLLNCLEIICTEDDSTPIYFFVSVGTEQNFDLVNIAYFAGCNSGGVGFLVLIFSFLIFSTLLY